jgi:hypothetical protein
MNIVAVPPERFDEFFAPVVGDTSRQQHLRHLLAISVGTDLAANPYASLRKGYESIVDRGIRTVERARPSKNLIERDHLINVKSNAKSGGRFVISTLRTIGDIYATHDLEVPQEYGGVRTNTQRAVRHIHGMAFSGADVAEINLTACKDGQDPRLSDSWFPTATHDFDTTNAYSVEMFTTQSTDDGQLRIYPRYPRLVDAGGAVCPATGARVEVGGIQKSALLTLMQIVGDVAVEEIFARSFDISQMPPLA